MIFMTCPQCQKKNLWAVKKSCWECGLDLSVQNVMFLFTKEGLGAWVIVLIALAIWAFTALGK